MDTLDCISSFFDPDGSSYLGLPDMDESSYLELPETDISSFSDMSESPVDTDVWFSSLMPAQDDCKSDCAVVVPAPTRRPLKRQRAKKPVWVKRKISRRVKYKTESTQTPERHQRRREGAIDDKIFDMRCYTCVYIKCHENLDDEKRCIPYPWLGDAWGGNAKRAVLEMESIWGKGVFTPEDVIERTIALSGYTGHWVDLLPEVTEVEIKYSVDKSIIFSKYTEKDYTIVFSYDGHEETTCTDRAKVADWFRVQCFLSRFFVNQRQGFVFDTCRMNCECIVFSAAQKTFFIRLSV